MKKFLAGLVIGSIGAAIWLSAGLVALFTARGLYDISTPAWIVLYFGAFVMMGGPVMFWLVLPVNSRLKRRR